MDWLAALKPGDDVIVSCSGITRILLVSKVERVLKLHVVVDGTKYRVRDGFVAGDNWARTHLVEPTPEMMARARRQTLERRAENAIRALLKRLGELPDEDLQRLVRLVAEKKAESSG